MTFSLCPCTQLNTQPCDPWITQRAWPDNDHTLLKLVFLVEVGGTTVRGCWVQPCCGGFRRAAVICCFLESSSYRFCGRMLHCDGWQQGFVMTSVYRSQRIYSRYCADSSVSWRKVLYVRHKTWWMVPVKVQNVGKKRCPGPDFELNNH